MAETNKSQANIEVTVDSETSFKTHTREGEIDTFSGITITRVHVDQRLDCPDMFTVEYELIVDMALTYIDSLAEGQEVEIRMGYEKRGEMPLVFAGEISYIEPNFGKEKGVLSISGYDRSHRLTRGTNTKSWDDAESDDIAFEGVVEDVVGLSGANHRSGPSDGLSFEGSTDNAVPSVPNISQLAINDYQFIRSIGGDFGYGTNTEAQGDKIEFRGLELADEVVTVVRDLRDGVNPVPALEARFRLSTVKQVTSVEVRGWDPKTKKNIVGIAESLSIDFRDTESCLGPEATARALYGSSTGHKVVIVDRPVASKEEADKVAQSVLDQYGLEFITGEAEFEGVPTLRAGHIIRFLGYGDRFDGNYLVTGCQHLFQPGESAYTCRVEIQRNFARESTL